MLRMFVLTLFTLLVLISSFWAVLALWFQLSFSAVLRTGLGTVWLGIAVMALWLVWGGQPWAGTLLYVCAFACLMLWWGQLKPSHQRHWADDLARITVGTVSGERVTLDNVRNFTWRTLEDYDERWESRSFDLAHLRSVDLITSEWGIPGIAHVLVSFGFDDGQFITFTVEIRRERDESFSAIGGFFKQFELTVLATDENDSVRVRTNVRGERAHIYRVTMPESAMRDLFLAYVCEANQLAGEARFYHTVTANCTIIVYNMMRRIVAGLPLDHRLFLSARLPSYVKDVGGLVDEPFEVLTEQGDFTERARRMKPEEDFSEVIRRGVPGWQTGP